LSVAKTTARVLQKRIANGPSWLAMGYITLASVISRHCLPRKLRAKLQSSIFSHEQSWPDLVFSARSVVVVTQFPIFQLATVQANFYWILGQIGAAGQFMLLARAGESSELTHRLAR
jgi:hypothetical protein